MTPAPTDRTRRRLLATTGGLLAAALAGCPAMDTPVDDDGGASPTPSDAPTTDPGPTTDVDATVTASPSTPEPDLREANVVGVEVTPEGDAYRFDVTLYHDDDGEDGYANWWQVETRAASGWAAATCCTPTGLASSPGRRPSRSPTARPASWSGATTRATATAGRRWW